MEEEKKKFEEELNEQVEEKIKSIMQQGIQGGNLDMLYKLVDIHKDLANEEYWKNEEEGMQMRYREYGANYSNYGRDNYGRENYGRDSYGRRARDSRGRYKDGDRSYQGEEMMDEMHQNYREYSEGKEQYMRGNYGAKEDTMKSLDYMLQSMVDFVEMLKEDANSPEEMELIKKYTRKISEM